MTLKLIQGVPRAEITHTIDVWALVEIVSSILAVCLPSLRTFFRRHRQGKHEQLGSSSGSRSANNRRGSGRESGSLRRAETNLSSHTKETVTIEEMWFRSESQASDREEEHARAMSPYEEDVEAYGRSIVLQKPGHAVLVVENRV